MTLRIDVFTLFPDLVKGYTGETVSYTHLTLPTKA